MNQHVNTHKKIEYKPTTQHHIPSRTNRNFNIPIDPEPIFSIIRVIKNVNSNHPISRTVDFATRENRTRGSDYSKDGTSAGQRSSGVDRHEALSSKKIPPLRTTTVAVKRKRKSCMASQCTAGITSW